MKSTKKFKVIMLPTKKETTLHFDNTVYHKLMQTVINIVRPYSIGQHLYVLSDEEIKEGDLARHTNNDIGLIMKIYSNNHFYNMKLLNGEISEGLSVVNGKKILASTDASLTPKSLIPLSFVDKFVKSFNEETLITEVELETEMVHKIGTLCPGQTTNLNIQLSLKTTSDGFIRVQENKMYNHNEVAYHIHSVLSDFAMHLLNNNNKPDGFDSDKWIDENL